MRTLQVQNGDIVPDSRGHFTWLESKSKLKQDIANVLLQHLYDDGSWGSQLHEIESGNVIDVVQAHKSLISKIVSDALDRLRSKQATSELTDDEKIASYSVAVEKLPGTSLSYFWFLQVVTESGATFLDTYEVALEHTRDPLLVNPT